MKKKLLLILTTILLAITTFTSKVFADDTTVLDLFNDYCTYLLDTSNSYSNGNASIHLVNDSGDLLLGFEYDSISDYEVVVANPIDYLTISDDDILFTFVLEDAESMFSPNYDTSEYLTIKFIINGYEITSIEVSGSTNTSDINGTYLPPNSHKTVADILDTVDGGYPVSADDVTVPEGCWTTHDGYRLYYTNDKSQLLVSDTPILTIDSNMVLTSDSDGNYKAVIPFFFNIYVKFVMNNNKLKKIDVSAPDISAEYFFEPVGNNRVTLDTLFWDLDVVPSSQDKAWVNENGAHIYIDDDDHIFYAELDNYIYSSFLCLNKPSYSNNVLFYEAIPSTITATLSNNKIQSLKINMTDADIDAACALYYYDDTEKGLFKKARGTYTKVTTVEDILSTAYVLNEFMFIKDEGKKATVATNALNIGGSDTVGITNPLTKEGNDYSYTSPLSPNPKFLFKMTNGKLSSIVVTNSATADTNGTYVPFDYQAPKTNYPIGYKGTISFRLNAPFADSSGIKVKVDNGADLTEGTDFTLSPGSIVITLTSDFVQTLTGPDHTFSVTLNNYPERTIHFTFSNSPSGGGGSSGYVIPNTGVSSNISK